MQQSCNNQVTIIYKSSSNDINISGCGLRAPHRARCCNGSTSTVGPSQVGPQKHVLHRSAVPVPPMVSVVSVM